MKKITIAAMCFVLTAALFVGCGCTNRNMDTTSEPTVLPTNEEVWESTQSTTRATTEATTMPTTMATDPMDPSTTIDNGNGPLEDSTTATEGNANSRTSRGIPNTK